MISSRLKSGYIAFTTFLIFSGVIFLASITLTLLSVSQANQSLAEGKGFDALSLAEGCVEDALLSSFFDENYSGGTYTLPEGDCVVTVSKVGNNWSITSQGVVDGSYVKTVQVDIVREDSIEILSWEQIE